ncbi:DUF5752 family protein [Sulfolobus acidocaldarius]|uniref:Conserved Archaeal protein n=4 Tax=Sulfolobus acidocaldarius TaxID=2285 RepID=Q4J7U9_SULAC|nr:DUF5752 family protein [Sulfolobus acidocaldarius]AAY81132.1 conserved Archaeal protein [Sulfolobus acidocaldarius DSM 639]AGE71742.1 hypothetical protein SacN8_08910 [Sulfolobus acidocaldarius N8]AGE74015.1 hypothetical protein SacRon12I_08920 [Sulfolobus acidocaldarius Ron12/I]ALU30055.1 hypothetical protein ATY89_08990 [Sulfolobus acidocaldarius]ALU30745.1 hypothetical protein ATZ20_00400 [Sulfolobus acidocaldarius]
MIDLDSKGKGIQFQFYAAYYPPIYSKLKANNIRELMEGVKKCDNYSLFYHIFHPVFSSHLIPEEYSNDFAHWISESLGDKELAELVSDIPGAEPRTVDNIRSDLINVLSLRSNGRVALSPFVFVSCRVITYKTNYVANTLGEFLDCLSEIPGRSLVWHFVTRRVLGYTNRNDFSSWLETNFGLSEVAEELSKIDPQTYVDEEVLRSDIIKTLERWLLK